MVPFASAFDSLQGCVELLQYWFRDNGLLLNPNKSAVAYFGTSRRLQCTKWRSAITLTGSSIRISVSLQILGVTLDSTLSLDPHINNIVKNCNYHLQVLRHIRPSITKITVTLCSTKCLTKTLTNCSEFSTNCLWNRLTATKCSAAMSQPALATWLL